MVNLAFGKDHTLCELTVRYIVTKINHMVAGPLGEDAGAFTMLLSQLSIQLAEGGL